MTVPAESASADRPRAMTPAELGFTPQRLVAWLAPVQLSGTAVRVVLAGLFGAYLDKRELQAALPADTTSHADVDELWIDFVADLGDGFDATYSIAWLLAQPSLALGGHDLPRADVLLMGGDEVYPTASWRQYEDRCKGPYKAALPEPPADRPAPTLYALPGNHDWYDGLTAFLRLFARRGKFGGWRTRQSRSYFAVELPHDWWLFAIDAQYDAYVDDPQLRYFKAAAEHLRPGDRVILAAPNPTWVQAHERPHEYDTLDYVIRTIIEPTGATVALMLSGDWHHYARYAGADRQLVTCGGGGAYLYATHHLPDRIDVPPRDTVVRHPSPSAPYELAASYPDRETSRRYRWGAFWRIPRRNPGFVLLLGALQTLLLLAFLSVGHRFLDFPAFAMVLLVAAATIGFAAPETLRRRLRHWLLGLGHAVAHIALAVAGVWAWHRLPFVDWPAPWNVAATLLYLPVVGVAAVLVVTGYLIVADAFGVNTNELFSGQGIEDSKSFLRLHLAPDGSLRIYPIGLAVAGHGWRPDPDAPAGAPWLAPTEPLVPHLIEQPVVVAGVPATRQSA